MILKVRHNYIVRSYKDFLLFLRDLEDMGFAQKNNYLFRWTSEKFTENRGISLVVTPEFYIKWGVVHFTIINNIEEIKNSERLRCSIEYKNYYVLYYEPTKILKYNKENICPQ